MIKTRISVAVAMLFAAPASALAFDTVDAILYPSSGAFPAYPAESAAGPVSYFVEGGVMHDNNVARLGSNTSTTAVLGNGNRSDTVTRLGAGIRYDQRIVGRQSLHLEARGDQYSYDRYSTFNNFSYGLLGEWRWELGNQLSGTVGYSRRRLLVDLAEVQALVKDMVTDQHAYATGAWQFTPRFRLRGGLDHGSVNRSDQTIAGTTNTGTAGIDYVTPLGNALGVEYRRTTGNFDAPQQVAPGLVISNQYVEREVAAVATYTAGPQWRFNGRLGRTTRDHTVVGQRDFRGTTGRAEVEWMPGNKTILGFSAYKAPQFLIDAAATYVLVTGVQFGPSWAPTAKLSFSARLINERRQFLGDPGPFLVPGTVQRDETLRGIRLGSGWEPARHFQISLGVDHGTRSSNLIGRDYNYTAVMAQARYNFF